MKKLNKVYFKNHLFDILALILTIASIFGSYIVADRIYERIPHIEDEMAYVWQAQVITRGDITRPSPACPTCFLVPFVVDHQGQRFGKYPLGWPVVLSFSISLGMRDWINPLLTGWTIWLMYRLIKRLTDPVTALIGAFLAASSPFLLLNSGTLLSHPWSLFLTVALCLAWIDLTSKGSRVTGWFISILAGLLIGCLVLTRPLSAVGIAIPFMIHGFVVLFKGEKKQKKNVLIVALVAGILASVHFLWQYALTGNALLNPYTLWWSYDTVGFGPGVGRQVGGFMPHDIWLNLKININAYVSDAFGWFRFSWIFLPFGIIALSNLKIEVNTRKHDSSDRCKILPVLPRIRIIAGKSITQAWIVGGILPAVICTYCFYWIGSWLFGPRYYYETLPSLVLFTAAGITWLAGKWKTISLHIGRRILGNYRPVIVACIVSVLVALNIVLYIPQRLNMMKHLYGASRTRFEPFQSESFLSKTPALIIVHIGQNWLEYGTLLDLSNPYFDTPYVFILDQGTQKDQLAIDQFPDRTVWLYKASAPNALLPISH